MRKDDPLVPQLSEAGLRCPLNRPKREKFPWLLMRLATRSAGVSLGRGTLGRGAKAPRETGLREAGA
jgi:hypothetical protein